MKSKWVTEPLQGVVSYIAKGMPPFYVEVEGNNTVRVLNQKCNRDFAISYTESRFHDLSKRSVPQEKYLRDEDILINSTGTGTAGRIAQLNIVPCPTIVDGHMIVLRGNGKIAPRYLGYALKARQASVLQLDEGSTGQTELNRDRLLSEIEISYPVSLEEQQAIADTLSALDARIAENRKINHHLEQMAQAIFKSWFVDFEPFADGEFIDSELGEIPAGWSVQTIEYLAAKVAMGPFGSNIKVETFVESGVPIISGNHLRGLYLDELGYNFITEEHARRLSNSLVRASDIIFTHAGNIGQVALIPDDCDYPYYVISQRQFYLRCDKTKALPEYINYFFHSREGQGKLLANASQTGVPSIARPSTHLKGIVVVLPPIEVQLKWFETVHAMLQTLNSNNKESKRLASIRDSLLPRLMSGELSVADIDVK